MGSTWALGLLLMRSHTDPETGSESPRQPLPSQPSFLCSGLPIPVRLLGARQGL